MAGIVESFEKLPLWQRFVLFATVSVAVVAGWYFFFYQDAVAARESADGALVKAQAELDRLTNEKANFLARKEKQEAVEAALQKQMAVLPMSASTVDNLMQTFQQQARLVGLTVEAWTPKAEEKQDFYARLPVAVRATGTWPQVGEFLRRVSELDRIVSVDSLSLEIDNSAKELDPTGHPMMDVSFEAATYRFLTETERTAVTDERKSTRRKGKKK